MTASRRSESYHFTPVIPLVRSYAIKIRNIIPGSENRYHLFHTTPDIPYPVIPFREGFVALNNIPVYVIHTEFSVYRILYVLHQRKHYISELNAYLLRFTVSACAVIQTRDHCKHPGKPFKTYRDIGNYIPCKINLSCTLLLHLKKLIANSAVQFKIPVSQRLILFSAG